MNHGMVAAIEYSAENLPAPASRSSGFSYWLAAAEKGHADWKQDAFQHIQFRGQSAHHDNDPCKVVRIHDPFSKSPIFATGPDRCGCIDASDVDDATGALTFHDPGGFTTFP